ITSVSADTPLGESWELSVSDEFPSEVESGRALSDEIASDPRAWLGAEAGNASTALLVKWLDAADNLSLQIHPEDDYAGLAAGESGKVEAWYVVANEPSAGVYFGFMPGVDARAVREVLAENGDLSQLMAFTPVQLGDLIVID